MELSIIIVSWNVKEKLRENLAALFSSQTDFSFEVIVVDNASGDGSAEMVEKEFPAVRLITNSENRGFAAANNQAIKLAQGNFLLLLNPDMRVQGDTLSHALLWAKNNPQATVTGIKLLTGEGKIIPQARRFPEFFDQLMIALKLSHLFPWLLNRYLNKGFDYSLAQRVDSIRGAFFLINRQAFRSLSGRDVSLDERYFVWFEEVDFCREVYERGGAVWYTPEAVCLDYVGQSFKQLERGKSQQYFRDSMLKYFAKHGKRWQYLGLRLAWQLVFWIF